MQNEIPVQSFDLVNCATIYQLAFGVPRTKIELNFQNQKLKATMNILRKRFKTAILALGLALGVMFGSTQQSKAAFYNNYYTLYSYYLTLYHSTGVAQYYWEALASYYYYLAGYYGDYFGYYSDPYGYKSTNYRGSTTYAGYYYNTYAYYGDYYLRL